jgi:hypothetical protein
MPQLSCFICWRQMAYKCERHKGVFRMSEREDEPKSKSEMKRIETMDKVPRWTDDDERKAIRDYETNRIELLSLNGSDLYTRGRFDQRLSDQVISRQKQNVTPVNLSDEVQKLLRLIAVESAKVRELEDELEYLAGPKHD